MPKPCMTSTLPFEAVEEVAALDIPLLAAAR